jgi:hypothetical protein
MSIQVYVCFVIDCTASMSVWIEEAKNKTVEIMDNVKRDQPNATILVGFVGYRDYGDARQYKVVDFSPAEYTMNAIQDVYAEGGDDEAEDVAGALFRALHLCWSAGDVRMIFHIADAPAHGLDFHSATVSDRFPRGDPNGLDPRDSVEKFSFLNIDYTFVKTSNTTDSMIEKFAKCYAHGGMFQVLDLRPQGPRVSICSDPAMNLSREVTRHITQSIAMYTSSQAP